MQYNELTLHIPSFTDFSKGLYLKEVLENIKPTDVIAIEQYHEFKDIIMDYLHSNYSIIKLNNRYVTKMKEIDPELIKREPKHEIASTFEFILERLQNKKFQALETLEDYDYYSRDLIERNIVIYTNLGQVINKYAGKTNNVILLTAFGHSLFIEQHIGKKDELDINMYNKLEFKELKKIEKEKQSIKIVYSL